MKKRGLIAFITMMMLLVSTMFVSADDGSFKLVNSYPKDGQKNTSIENVGVKLQFNNSVSDPATAKANAKRVKIISRKTGKKLPIKVLTSKKNKGMVLVLGDNSDGRLRVENNAKYELVISKNFSDDNGNKLGKNTTLTFTTFNQRMNNMVNMLLMVVMFGGIMFLTMRQTKQKAEEEMVDKREKKEGTFNPYKEAKRTGKSVEQVIAEEKKKEAKLEKKKRRKGEKEEEEEIKNLSDLLPYVYHVHAPRPISAAGGKYKSGLGRHDDEGDSGKKNGHKGGKK